MNTRESGHIRQFSNEPSVLTQILDALLIWLCLRVLCKLYSIEATQADPYQYLSIVSVALYLLVANIRSVYRSARLEGYFQIA